MKKLLFMFTAIVLSFTVQAQTTPAKGLIYSLVRTTDTLGASTTLTYEFTNAASATATGTVLDFPLAGWTYSFYVEADSISGSNAGTVELQVSNSLASNTSPRWITVDTDTIDGTANQYFLYEGDILARRVRLKITSPSGTRKTNIFVEGTAKYKQ